MPTRILVIDDDLKITDVLRRGLTYQGYLADIAHGGEEGLRIALEQPPDLVILDVLMPGLDGLEVCRRLRAAGDLPILLLTARDAVEDRVAGLDSGADDYLVKPFAFEELLARVRALLRRRPDHAAAILRFGDLELDTAARTAQRAQRPIGLTTTEYQLLQQFMQHPRQVLTRDQLLERVWGFDTSVDTHVLEVYVSYLRQKLETNGESRLIHTVRGAGYALRAAAE
jgi:two-component system response regulator MprA